MKILFVLLLAVVAALSEDDKYTDKYDNIDVDEILANRRLLISYTNCMLDRGRCNSEGRELKKNLADALETGCSKCTAKQEEITYKMIGHIIEHELPIWKELCAKFDPSNVFRKTYEDKARARGVIIPQD